MNRNAVLLTTAVAITAAALARADILFETSATLPGDNHLLGGAAVDPGGNVYFADGNTSSIYEYAPGLSLQRTITDGRAGRLTGVAVSPTGALYTSGREGTLAEFNPDGTFNSRVIQFGPNNTLHFSLPFDVAVNAAGTVFVPDFTANPINIALAYVLHQPFPTFPLIGPRTLEETRTSLDALTLPLTPHEVRWLNLEAASPTP